MTATLALLRRAWPYLAIALLAAGLFQTRATLARVKLEAKNAQLATQLDAAAKYGAAADRHIKAETALTERTAALQPLIIRSTDTVRTYAQTPAGRVPCLAADRLRGIDDFDLSLFTPASAGRSTGAVPADADAPPAGRERDQR